MGTIEIMEEREAQQRERARREAEARVAQEQEIARLHAAQEHAKQINLLLMMFESMQSEEAHRRGYLLQDLLNRVFDIHGIPVIKSFTRNEGAEQIDGAFKLEGWHYLVECRWRQKLADIRELDGVKGQVDRSGKQVMGFFLSINGWSEHVPVLLKQNPQKSIVLMDGYDLRCVLDGQIELRSFILAKIEKLSVEGEAFYGAAHYLRDR
jgi:hypothetical protein